MKARIEVSDFVHTVAGSPLTQACADATRDLLADGGEGQAYQVIDRDVYVYTFDGPDPSVRAVVAAFMNLIHTTEGRRR